MIAPRPSLSSLPKRSCFPAARRPATMVARRVRREDCRGAGARFLLWARPPPTDAPSFPNDTSSFARASERISYAATRSSTVCAATRGPGAGMSGPRNPSQHFFAESSAASKSGASLMAYRSLAVGRGSLPQPRGSRYQRSGASQTFHPPFGDKLFRRRSAPREVGGASSSCGGYGSAAKDEARQPLNNGGPRPFHQAHTATAPENGRNPVAFLARGLLRCNVRVLRRVELLHPHLSRE